MSAGATVVATVVASSEAEWGETYRAPRTRASGRSRSRLVAPAGYSLWLTEAVLEPDATLAWDTGHGDEAVVVLEGSVDLGGVRCPGGGALVVESGVATELRATERAHIVHFGPTAAEVPEDGPLGAPDRNGHGVHVFDESGRLAIDGGRVAVYFADSHCPTCRLTLLKNIRPPASRIPSHLHSQDELVYLVAGTAKVGSLVARAGDVLAIPAAFRYSLRTETGCTFLNYRRDAAWMTAAPSHPPVLEAIDDLEAFGAALMAG